MRIDHIAYQRASRVASFGLALQLGIALILLLLGFLRGDTPFVFASIYVGIGALVWLGLFVVFLQHKQERLEGLEHDELAAASAAGGSVFDETSDEARVAGRRLRLMHKWLMPAVSLLVALLLVGGGALILRYLDLLNAPDDHATEFFLTPDKGWFVAIALGLAAAAFIFSRFVAGMAKQPAWQNLRGGAGYMVGNALVLLAIAVGLIFRFFENDSVIRTICFALPIFMFAVAGEIALNFILNMYRPRIPGEVPRPAFDSRVLSLLAAPDSLVRSLNEAINYQFGFDVTSSWGYQLLLRSFAWLLGFGVLVLLLLNMMVVVEPHQQAIVLSGGRIVGETTEEKVRAPGLTWKLPWPLQTAEVYDVARIRELSLTPRIRDERVVDGVPVRFWDAELKGDTDLRPFIVGTSRLSSVANLQTEIEQETEKIATQDDAAPTSDDQQADEQAAEVSEKFALVDAEFILQYRIRPGQGLLDFLHFASDEIERRERLPVRERALRQLAMREVSQHLSRMGLEEVLSTKRAQSLAELRDRIQKSFDSHRTGVEVVAMNIPTLRPAGTSAATFEEVPISRQTRFQRIAEEEQQITAGLALLAGSPEQAAAIVAEIKAREALIESAGKDSPQVTDLTVKIERMLVQSGGTAAIIIGRAEADRWVKQMEEHQKLTRSQGQQILFAAAPRLYMQREIMRAFHESLANVPKYIFGIDPARINLDIETKNFNPVFGTDFKPLDAQSPQEAPQP